MFKNEQGKNPFKEPITREQAYALAIVYLGTQMLRWITVTEVRPDTLTTSECWYVQVPDRESMNRLDGPGPRYIAISKETGDIVYDGRIGYGEDSLSFLH